MPRIVHLGFGNFHRAHQAWYTELANRRNCDAPPWQITGVSMRRPDLRNALKPDGYRYTLAICGLDATTFERISVHDDILVASENPEAVLDRIAGPETRIVTLTVTEKGYHLKPASGALDLTDAQIRADLGAPLPRSAVGLLAQGLERRARTGAGGLTVVSCDNISGNGRKLRDAVALYADAAGLDIAAMFGRLVTFPDTMVDRITPATTDETRRSVAEATGRSEPDPVLTERFCEWIIQDDFAAEFPDWSSVGVEIVADVAPFEARKLRMLNAAHSYLAYAGLLAGHCYVHEAIADAELRAGVEQLFEEAAFTLPDAIQPTLPGYREALLARFDVAEMKHALSQIAMDGSQKLPMRLLPNVIAHREPGQHARQSTIAIAAWIAWLVRSVGMNDPIHDPAAETLGEIIRSHHEISDLCRALMAHLLKDEMPDDWFDFLALETGRLLERR